MTLKAAITGQNGASPKLAGSQATTTLKATTPSQIQRERMAQSCRDGAFGKIVTVRKSERKSLSAGWMTGFLHAIQFIRFPRENPDQTARRMLVVEKPRSMPIANQETSAPLIKRRSALGTLGMGALATWAGTMPASAFFFGSKKSAVDLSGLPSHWMAMQGGNLQAYAEFLADLRLKYISPRQVIDAHAKRRGTVWNMLPPKHLWKSIAPTLKTIDRVGAQLGQPVKEVVSAYRSPAYNLRCSGARRGSWHQANVAVDVKFPVSSWTVSKTSRALRSRGIFRGGVGHYSGFTHIDTRGQNVDW
jgi:hypothetical protein